MVKNNTRKRKQTKVMTIPQLRKGFESINIETAKILAKHPINEDSITSFKKVWKQVFGKLIDSSTAETYLRLQVKHTKASKSKSKTYKKQKGGSAPIEYMMTPGIDSSQGTVQGAYGSFLPYVSSGLSFYNHINNIAMDSECGKTNITPQIAIDMGSNKVGGQRIITSSVPPSLLQDAQNLTLGKQLGESPNPLQTTYKGL